jgi:hypothetical protein
MPKVFRQEGDETAAPEGPHLRRKVRPLVVRSADLLALRAARGARLPRINALCATASSDGAVRNRPIAPDEFAVVESASERRAN